MLGHISGGGAESWGRPEVQTAARWASASEQGNDGGAGAGQAEGMDTPSPNQ